MGRDELFDIWNSGNDRLFHDKKTDKAMIEKLLRKKTTVASRSVNFNIVFYFFFQLANIILISGNLAGYKNNQIIFWSLVAMLIFSVGFLLFGTYLFYKFREINRFSDTLINLINKQLQYFKTSYEFWLLIIAFSTLILIFNLGILVDYDNGQYRINHKGLFITINAAVFVFIYASQKIAASFFTKNLKAYLNDLRNGLIDETIRLERTRRKYQWIWVVLVIILIIIFLAGILNFQKFG